MILKLQHISTSHFHVIGPGARPQAGKHVRRRRQGTRPQNTEAGVHVRGSSSPAADRGLRLFPGDDRPRGRRLSHEFCILFVKILC